MPFFLRLAIMIFMAHAVCMYVQLSASAFTEGMADYWSQTPFGSYSGAIPGIVWLNYGFLKEFGLYAVLPHVVSVFAWVVFLIGAFMWTKRLFK